MRTLLEIATSVYKKMRRHAMFAHPFNRSCIKNIKVIQDLILNNNPHPHYINAYRAQELSYWLYVAKWIGQLKENSITNVLDIGCAYGTLAVYSKSLFSCDVYCTDFTDRYISSDLIETSGLRFQINNIERDSFPWSIKFDLIVFTEIIEHLNFNPFSTLLKIYDLLADDGKLFISTPDSSEWGRVTKYYSRFDDIPDFTGQSDLIDDHVWQYSQVELLDLFKRVGFKVEKVAYSPGMIGKHINMQLSKQKVN